MPLTDAEIAAIRAREQAATPGPWETVEYVNLEGNIESFVGFKKAPAGWWDEDSTLLKRADAQFIAYARTDIPALLADLEEARKVSTAATRFVRACREYHRWTMTQMPDHVITERIAATNALFAAVDATEEKP